MIPTGTSLSPRTGIRAGLPNTVISGLPIRLEARFLRPKPFAGDWKRDR
jgi:hypothetical protein